MAIAGRTFGADALRRQRALQAKDKLAAGTAYVDEGYVFADPLGTRLNPRQITTAFATLAKRAGLATTSVHSLRHTAGTALVAGGRRPVCR